MHFRSNSPTRLQFCNSAYPHNKWHCTLQAYFSCWGHWWFAWFSLLYSNWSSQWLNAEYHYHAGRILITFSHPKLLQVLRIAQGLPYPGRRSYFTLALRAQGTAPVKEIAETFAAHTILESAQYFPPAMGSNGSVASILTLRRQHGSGWQPAISMTLLPHYISSWDGHPTCLHQMWSCALMGKYQILWLVCDLWWPGRPWSHIVTVTITLHQVGLQHPCISLPTHNPIFKSASVAQYI